MKQLCVAVMWGSIVCGSAPAATLHVDDFEDGTAMQWVGGQGGLPANQPTGGPGGDGDAYLRVVSGGSNLATYNLRGDWIGDLSAVGAVRMTAHMMNPPESAPLEMRIVLFGPTHTFNRWTSTVSQAVPNDGVWRRYEFSLTAAEMTRVLGSGTYSQALADVQRVMFRHDPGTPTSGGSPVSGILNLDNIELAVAAPPRSAADFNDDGNVDGADLEAWELGFGAAGGAGADDGDADGDLDVDGADFLHWQREFALVEVMESQPVPEPAAGVMVAAVGGAALRSRRRSSR